MGKLFENLNLTLAAGLILALALMGIFHAETLTAAVVFRWFHVFFGITWIGLLYYFNFVQIPVMPTVPAELKPGVYQIAVRGTLKLSTQARTVQEQGNSLQR